MQTPEHTEELHEEHHFEIIQWGKWRGFCSVFSFTVSHFSFLLPFFPLCDDCLVLIRTAKTLSDSMSRYQEFTIILFIQRHSTGIKTLQPTMHAWLDMCILLWVDYGLSGWWHTFFLQMQITTHRRNSCVMSSLAHTLDSACTRRITYSVPRWEVTNLFTSKANLRGCTISAVLK